MKCDDYLSMSWALCVSFSTHQTFGRTMGILILLISSKRRMGRVVFWFWVIPSPIHNGEILPAYLDLG